MSTHPVWSGIRMVDMLNQIVNESDDVVFPGAYGAVDMAAFDDVYPDPYHNYFCATSEEDEDHVILALHPAVKPVIDAIGAPNLEKYLWFGHQSDPIEVITPQKAAQLIRNNKRKRAKEGAPREACSSDSSSDKRVEPDDTGV